MGKAFSEEWILAHEDAWMNPGVAKFIIALAVREAVHQAVAGHPVLFVTLELSPHEISEKIDAATEGERTDLPIWLWDESADLREIVREVEKWVGGKDGGGIPVVVLDYLQLVQSPEQLQREREVALAAQTLARLARRRGFLFVASAQLNRASQTDDRPKLHHLRESGGIEQAADIALILARDGEDRLRVTVGKARFGGTGRELDLSCDFARCRLAPLDASDAWRTLSEKVVLFLTNAGGRAKLRDLSRGLWVEHRRPTVTDLVSAASATGAYVVEGPEARLP